MRTENKMMIVYIIAGILVGFLSQVARNAYAESGNYIAISLAVIFLVVTTEVNKKIFKICKNFSWFLSNGGWIFIFVWFISWILFFNPPFGVL